MTESSNVAAGEKSRFALKIPIRFITPSGNEVTFEIGIGWRVELRNGIALALRRASVTNGLAIGGYAKVIHGVAGGLYAEVGHDETALVEDGMGFGLIAGRADGPNASVFAPIAIHGEPKWYNFRLGVAYVSPTEHIKRHDPNFFPGVRRRLLRVVSGGKKD